MPRFKQKPMHPSQIMLFGQSVDDAVAADSDVRSFNDVMDCLDYSLIESKCSSCGRPPYPPKEMVKILTYAYSKGIRSSRRIEELLKVDVRFMWIAGGLKPDHNTIARFRKDAWEELGELFKDSIRICIEAGLVFLNVVATDGTKIAAASSRRRIYKADRLERELAAVEEILAEAQEVDRTEDESEQSSNAKALPEDLKDAKARKAKLAQIAERLLESGKSSVVESEVDARVMKASDRIRPCYNLQASVDSQNQVIVAQKLTQDETDFGKLPEMVEEVISNTGLAPDVLLADCGYCNESTLKWIEESGHDVLMPIKEQHRESGRNDRFASKCFIADYERDVLICPVGRELKFRVEHFCNGGYYRQYAATGCQDCPFYNECVKSGKGSRRINISCVDIQRKLMKEKIKTDEGKKLFSMRSYTIEPVFGQSKWNRKFDRFLCWGLNATRAESALMCIVHNILKCIRNEAARAYCAEIRRHFEAIANILYILDVLTFKSCCVCWIRNTQLDKP